MRSDWTPASVGCHWFRGPWGISTFAIGGIPGPFPQSGYTLAKEHAGEVGRFATFEEAEREADWLEGEGR